MRLYIFFKAWHTQFVTIIPSNSTISCLLLVFILTAALWSRQPILQITKCKIKRVEAQPFLICRKRGLTGQSPVSLFSLDVSECWDQPPSPNTDSCTLGPWIRAPRGHGHVKPRMPQGFSVLFGTLVVYLQQCFIQTNVCFQYSALAETTSLSSSPENMGSAVHIAFSRVLKWH